jgi:hypothetical protein
MKIFIPVLSILIFSVNLYSQEIGVPFRVGNKFGISNKDGKMLIQPQFDFIKVNTVGDNFFFEAYTAENNRTLSSLIFNNKVIIGNKTYSDYHVDVNFFIATEYILEKNQSNGLFYKTGEINNLYNFNGERIFQEDLADIVIIEDFEDTSISENDLPKNTLQELLFVTKDLSGKYSLFVYDKKTKKIVSSFFKKTPYLEITYNYQNYYLDKTITCIYEDVTGKGIKIKLKKENTKFKISTNESIEIKKKPQRTQVYNMLPEFEATLEKNTFSEKKFIKKYNESEEKKILNISSVKVKKDFYYLPVKVETIENCNVELNADDNYAVWDKEKIGLYSVHANSLIIPNSYDAIVKDETLQNNYKCPPVFILINQNKYGLFIYDSPKNKIIEPVFDKIPLLVDYNYFGKSQPLLKLYDQNGNLFSYCNEEGKIYYSEK